MCRRTVTQGKEEKKLEVPLIGGNIYGRRQREHRTMAYYTMRGYL